MYDEIFLKWETIAVKFCSSLQKKNTFFFPSEKLTIDQRSQEGEGKSLHPDFRKNQEFSV